MQTEELQGVVVSRIQAKGMILVLANLVIQEIKLMTKT